MTRRDFFGTAAASSALGQAQNSTKKTSDTASCTSCPTSSSGQRSLAAQSAGRRTWIGSQIGHVVRALLYTFGRLLSRSSHTLSGAYHWHNGVYNQVHSAPSVHRDMFETRSLLTATARCGLQARLVGKWHASWLRGPLEFGFQEVADLTSYRDAARDDQQLR